jgi:hypothetical protein
MGLLDDAIREHLDLKRRRGADPAEVQRAEQEALGPVRRGPIGAEPPALVLDEAHQPEWDAAHEDDAPIAPRAEAAADPFADEDPFGDPEAPKAKRPSPPPPALTGERYGEPFDEDLDEPVPPPHRAPIPQDQLGETMEYNVEEAIGEGAGDTGAHARPATKKPPGEGTDEDPLEETPEFLQETPDHDRLWFEQRPPRDFDFDG